ncbi:chemotaxis protein CheB [Albimonas pacifica]|uniref:histidine kinase n=1 Tax=Albimonas pacifica TaxID=1114924 RepID=A0A1I3IXP7_9RHOB|nr:chemotaxis protein CheB [Albimonas pacifica]SFI52645.1 two-component system, chemotaxis family, CheB/CheR fusion protein [Albimonas pacifica]
MHGDEVDKGSSTAPPTGESVGPGSPETFPIIAVGASAGGLKVCGEFLSALRPETEAAVVVIAHLDPNHRSLMAQLLARASGLVVHEAADGDRPAAGTVHVIPPGVFLRLREGRLRIEPPAEGEAVRRPFDVFLRSLADDAGARAVCVVLSGNGDDGTEGLESVHSAGGLTLVQDPDEAEFPGMPQAALDTGLADATGPVRELAAMLLDLDRLRATAAQATRRRRTRSSVAPATVDGGTDVAIYRAILALAGEVAAQDLTLYKNGTLRRRIAQRMALAGISAHAPGAYLDLLRRDPKELDRLAADLLIHVTGFFRDPEVFDRLAQSALPKLFEELPAGRPLRIWSAGCSTGEEAYSLAIICDEVARARGEPLSVRILASDIDPAAISVARAGLYAGAATRGVSAERLKRYFVQEPGGWRVNADLREKVIFSVHDMLSDPPFSRIDLLACRNVLIYLGDDAKRRVLESCLFALRPRGLLLLGRAETPGEREARFTAVDRAIALWRKSGAPEPGDLAIAPGGRAAPVPALARGDRGDIGELCRRLALEAYAPAAALLNRRLQCLYLLGHAGRYLEIAPGYPKHDFIAMAPMSIRARVRAAAETCVAGGPPVRVLGGVAADGRRFVLELRATRVDETEFLLAAFLDSPVADDAPAASGPEEPRIVVDGVPEDAKAETARLRRDLSEVQTALENELEAHAADNAEALSVREEYQSANEELLASKEELQSLNEELTALNSQLQDALEEQRTTASDLQNVLYSTEVATLFLDADLCIRFFTPRLRAMFRVIPTDLGRPLQDLAALIEDPELEADCRKVIAGAGSLTREVEGLQGKWYRRQAQSYRAGDGAADGVVVTFFDITEDRRATEALQAARAAAERADRAKSGFLAAASHDLRQPLQSLTLIHNLLGPGAQPADLGRLRELLDDTIVSMSAMLDALLDTDRIESGALRPEIKPVPLGPLIERVLAPYRASAVSRGLRLRVPPTHAWTRSDPRLLETVLRNLVSNAIKYTASGGVLVGLRRRPGGRLSLQVCDTGSGFSETDAVEIFEPYRRLDQPDAPPGVGLGLSIVRRVCDLLEHPVSVRSRPGHGSCFGVELPLAPADPPKAIAPPDGEDGDDPAGDPPASAPAAGGDGGPASILVIEDDQPLRELLIRTLEGQGHRSVGAGDRQEGLRRFAGIPGGPDLLLIDYDLHGDAAGLALARELSAAAGRTIPTVVLTGNVTRAAQQAIARAGCLRLSKPASSAQLARAIARLRKRRDPAPASSAPAAGAAIHLVEDDDGARELLRRALERADRRIFDHASGEAFLASPEAASADCLVLDARLPGMDGIALLERLRSAGPPPPTIMVTAHGDLAMAVRAMRAGAVDFIEKPVEAEALSARIDAVLEAGRPASGADADAAESGATDGDAAREAALDRLSRLTSREREVLDKVLEGLANKTIANDLGISQRTVESHRAAIMRRMGCASLPDLVRLAIAAGLQ